jgi:ryanodine receptor 2
MQQDYEPRPLDTSTIQLEPDILELTERLAENTHDVWARGRLREGWTYGPQRDDALKQHPCLIAYAQLSESEKEYDRATAMETIKAILALGYRIGKPEGTPSGSPARQGKE